jgi:DNA-binding NarL/FixJ family response regulator
MMPITDDHKLEISNLLSEGKKPKEISERIGLGRTTVSMHIGRLQANNRRKRKSSVATELHSMESLMFTQEKTGLYEGCC